MIIHIYRFVARAQRKVSDVRKKADVIVRYLSSEFRYTGYI